MAVHRSILLSLWPYDCVTSPEAADSIPQCRVAKKFKKIPTFRASDVIRKQAEGPRDEHANLSTPAGRDYDYVNLSGFIAI